MSQKLGLEAKTYFGPPGSAPAQVPANELSNIRDLTLNLETGEADTTTRAAEGWRSTRATLKDGTVEFEMVWDDEDPGFEAIKDAFFDNTLIALLVLDEEGGEGLDADFSITNFTRTEPLEEVLGVQVTAKPNADNRAPAWVE